MAVALPGGPSSLVGHHWQAHVSARPRPAQLSRWGSSKPAWDAGGSTPDRHRRRHDRGQGGAGRPRRPRSSPNLRAGLSDRPPAPGHVEQDPADWLSGVAGRARRLRAPATTSAASAASALPARSTPTSSSTPPAAAPPGDRLAGRRAAAPRPRRSTRPSAGREARLVRRADADRREPRAGRMAWVAAREPDAWARNRARAGAQGLSAALKLTGARRQPTRSRPSASSTPTWATSTPLLARVPRRRRAARRRSPTRSTPVGGVRDGLPCAGVPVTLGTMDAWAGMFGVGVARRRRGDVPERHQRGPRPDLARCACRPPASSSSPNGAASSCTPRRPRPAAPRSTGSPASSAARPTRSRGSPARRGRDREPALPAALEGERAPLWDTGARGAFAGLDRALRTAANWRAR